MHNLETIISILGDDNIKRIQSELTEMIIDDLRESLKSEWFVLPSQWDDMFDKLGEEVFEEVKKKYKKQLKNIAEEKIKKFIEEQTNGVGERK